MAGPDPAQLKRRFGQQLYRLIHDELDGRLRRNAEEQRASAVWAQPNSGGYASYCYRCRRVHKIDPSFAPRRTRASRFLIGGPLRRDW